MENELTDEDAISRILHDAGERPDVPRLRRLVRAAIAAGRAKQAAVPLDSGSDNERERMRLAGISTAAMGYWKEGDFIHPDYDTAVLRDVAKLYAKYVEASKDAKRHRWWRENIDQVSDDGDGITGVAFSYQIDVIKRNLSAGQMMDEIADIGIISEPVAAEKGEHEKS